MICSFGRCKYMKLKFMVFLFISLMICLVLSSCDNSNVSDQTQNNNFEFSLESDNTYSIKTVAETAEGKIVIPEQYNGLAVTKIQSSAFVNCKSITEVYIPNSIVEIGYGAFSGCSALEKMTLPFVGTKALNVENEVFEYHHIGAIFGWSEYEESVQTTPNNSLISFYLPKSLKTIIVTGDAIYGDAFSDCSYIESISLTGNVKELESGLFQDCIRLFEINLPSTIESVGTRVFTNTGYYNDNRNWDGKLLYINDILIAANKNIFGDCIIREGTRAIAGYAFDDCVALQSVTIPEGVTKIESGTFSGCSNLKSISIPKSVNYIDSAFYECEKLEEVYISNIEKWLSIEGYGSPLEYANKLYLNNEEIKSLEIPNTISKINKYALSFDTLEQVFVPSSVASIESYAFYGASNLKQIYLSEGLVSIGKNAFENCSHLSSIVIPKTVNSIGWNVFKNTALYKENNFYIDNWLIKGADSYGTYTIPNNITHIADGAFYNCDRINHVIIPNSVTHIGNEVFSNCNGLKSVSMSENLQVIGEQAFFASGLSEITLPVGLKEIHSSAFLHCENLNNITIPNTVVHIGEKAFALCPKLTSIIIPESVVSVEAEVFKECENLTIFCVVSSQPTSWSDEWNYSGCPVVWGYSPQ